jgi:lysophospholipase L1-like esterase
MSPRTSPPRASSAAARLLDFLPLLGIALVLLLALSWYDVLPGGWRLRRCVEPRALTQDREDETHIASRLAQFSRENPGMAPGAVVFLGSSTIERFPLALAFPGKPCANRGIANLAARDLAHILPECLPIAKPSGIVLYTGAIDWRASGCDLELLAARVDAVLAALSHALPDVPATLMGILPERGMDTGRIELLRRANARLASLARERNIAFVDPARPPIASPTGALSRELSADDLHLNEEGYRHLARWIVEDGGEVGRLLAP